MKTQTAGRSQPKPGHTAETPLITSPVLAARLKEIDVALDLTIGEGVAEVVLGDIIEDIKKDAAGSDSGLITGGWEFEKGRAWALRKLRRLGNKWAAEDAAGKEAS